MLVEMNEVLRVKSKSRQFPAEEETMKNTGLLLSWGCSSFVSCLVGWLLACLTGLTDWLIVILQ